MHSITAGSCQCPECGEDMRPPSIMPCTCPTLIVIPPGQHIHVDCPRHGRVKIYGPSYTY